MARPELGVKRICPTTGKKFYDMNRDPIVSPFTGEAFARSVFDPPARGAAVPAARRVQEEEAEVEPAGPEMVSLEDVEAAENVEVVAEDEEIEAAPADDTFLEEEEEGTDDVSGLIDGDLEEDEES